MEEAELALGVEDREEAPRVSEVALAGVALLEVVVVVVSEVEVAPAEGAQGAPLHRPAQARRGPAVAAPFLPIPTAIEVRILWGLLHRCPLCSRPSCHSILIHALTNISY